MSISGREENDPVRREKTVSSVFRRLRPGYACDQWKKSPNRNVQTLLCPGMRRQGDAPGEWPARRAARSSVRRGKNARRECTGGEPCPLRMQGGSTSASVDGEHSPIARMQMGKADVCRECTSCLRSYGRRGRKDGGRMKMPPFCASGWGLSGRSRRSKNGWQARRPPTADTPDRMARPRTVLFCVPPRQKPLSAMSKPAPMGGRRTERPLPRPEEG